MTQKAQDRINEAIKTKATSLNLSECELTEIPQAVGRMNWLIELNLSKNPIKAINGLSDLTNLTKLNLDNNQITTIRSLSDLVNLTNLWLDDNKITTIKGLAKLVNLTELRLSSNQITTISGLDQLVNLTQLRLSSNQITTISGLDQLVNLTQLWLQSNQITTISGLDQLVNLTQLWLDSNQIINISPLLPIIEQIEELRLEDISLFDKLIKLRDKHIINLHNNPITTPPLEIVRQGKEAILNYFKSDATEQIYEAKMLVLGAGGVGKTSLCEKIKDKNYTLKAETTEGTTTEGIDILDYSFPIANNKKFKVNLWDFGGQSIYHATHQFFLSKRSLYILLTDTRKEDDDLPYWLNIQQLLAGDSPMLVVQNEKFDRKKPLKENEIRGAFKNIKGFLTTNLNDNRGLDTVVKAVHAELQQLDHIGSMLPKSWVDIRAELETIKTPYISQKEYHAICAKHGMKEANGKPNKEEALFLSRYFHDLGVVLHFHENPILKRIVILDNEWATDAVYKVFDDKKVKKNWGRFTFDDLEAIWSDEKYEDKQLELETLMKEFKLCFELKNKKGYLAPHLLPADRANYDWGTDPSLQLRYTYEFMPKGILPRLIVALHTLIKEQLIWNTGGIFEKDGATAEVMEVYNKKEISIRIKGTNPAALRGIIIHQMDQINSSFQHLKVEKLVPCNCKHCSNAEDPAFHKEEKLLTFYEHKKYKFDCDKPPFAQADVLDLLISINNKAVLGEFAREVQALISKGNIERALIVLDENSESMDTPLRDELSLLTS